jgi:hypothetical protein
MLTLHANIAATVACYMPLVNEQLWHRTYATTNVKSVQYDGKNCICSHYQATYLPYFWAVLLAGHWHHHPRHASVY